MSLDEPLAPAPSRGFSPLATNLLVGLLAFAGGVAAMVGMEALHRGGEAPAPGATQTPLASRPQAVAPLLPPGTDIATLNAREELLAGRLDRLELRLREIDSGARAASSYATQAERLMIAFSVRRAIERGQALGPLEAQLRQRFAEDHGEAVSTIVQAAGQPVTLEDLRLALDTIAPRLVRSPDESLWARVRRMLGDLVVLRRADAASPRPADRVRRARRMLAEGQVEAALAEVARTPGVEDAQSWVTAARRFITGREALREIEVAAMQTPTPPPAPGA